MSAGSARENGRNEDMEKEEGEKEEQEEDKKREEEEEEEKEREGEKEREEEGGEKENKGEKEKEEEENKKQKQKGGQEEEEDLFRLVVVNSYGSQEVQRLKDDDSIPLKLGSEWMCVRGWRGGGRWIGLLAFIFATLLFPQIRRTLRVSGRQT